MISPEVRTNSSTWGRRGRLVREIPGKRKRARRVRRRGSKPITPLSLEEEAREEEDNGEE